MAGISDHRRELLRSEMAREAGLLSDSVKVEFMKRIARELLGYLEDGEFPVQVTLLGSLTRIEEEE